MYYYYIPGVTIVVIVLSIQMLKKRKVLKYLDDKMLGATNSLVTRLLRVTTMVA